MAKRVKRCKKGYKLAVRRASCKCVKSAAKTVVRRAGHRPILCRSRSKGTWARKTGCVKKCVKRYGRQ